MKKSIAITLATVVTLGTIGGVMAVNKPQPVGADSSPLVTQVDNHEARITNLEKDTYKIQQETGVSPSPNKTSVPAVTQQAPTQTNNSTSTSPVVVEPETAAVTVTAYKEIVIDAENSDCEYTYSDGTTYRFHWKTTNPKGSYMTDGDGSNGRWVKSVQKSGLCDDRAIGLPKAK